LRRLLLLIFGLVAIVAEHLAPAQDRRSGSDLMIRVTHVERNRYGFLITVDLMNDSGRTLFLPEASGWRKDSPGMPRIQSLGVGQWSDGKTNLLASGRSISSSLPPRAGYFSVGPCRDIPFDGHWISLVPSQHFADQIQAFEPPSDGYIPSSCTWRHAHLRDQLRVSLRAFQAAQISMRNSVYTSASFRLTGH